MSGRELARRAKWDEQKVRRRLRGTSPITVDELDEIAAALEISVNDLIPPPRDGETPS